MCPAIAAADTPLLEHNLSIVFDEGNLSFTARDRIVTHPSRPVEAGLPGFSLSPGWRVRALAFDGQPADVRAHVDNGRINVPGETGALDISYEGEVNESQWPYIVWLPGDGWYPEAKDHRIRFKLTLAAPPGWSTLTQGTPVGPAASAPRSWIQEDPQQGIYLVAGRWRSYFKTAGGHRARVMLIDADDDLARRYLDAALHHLDRYAKALGGYPYHDFTLVENRRQTGWGMPAFTLLGSRVIRLPFIVNTSFPHEILHNWWGNGVFVDRREGNWSEGLTTYLSDYLMRERRGEGRQYRLDKLVAWQDFADRGSDFPLSRFVGRHDRATQAVGYGKGMFLFHMLRRELGDVTFITALRKLYAGFRFQHASFGDIQQVFEHTCNCPLGIFFAQWLARDGAPTLRLDSAVSRIEDGKHAVTIALSQSGGEPWNLRVPLRVIDTLGNVRMQTVRLDGSAGSYGVDLDAPAARIDIDPEIDLFRRLDAGEKPTTFGKVFAARKVAVVAADDSFLGVANTLAGQYPGWAVSRAVAPERTDADVVVLLGQHPTAAAEWFAVRRLNRYRMSDAGVEITGHTHTLDGERVIALVDTVMVEGVAKTVLWIAASSSAGLPDLLRRLSHYGRFSYAVFNEPGQRAATSGQWHAAAQSLSRILDGDAPDVTVVPPPPLF